MPDKKITDLTELTTPVSTDVLAIVDVAANITKKIQVGNLPGGSGGGVTDVTGTAPITSTGGATPDIGITNATPSADGAMSAADKTKLDDIDITTPAAGEVLIYDSVAGVFENATLTQGTGISITNGDGSIEIAATGGGGGGVSSLETLTGALNLVGAGTVTVTDNGINEITITGSGGGGSSTKLDGQNIEYEVSATPLSSDGEFEGMVAKVGDAGNTLTQGLVYYWNGLQNDWVTADNTAEGTAKGIVGIALGSSGTADGVLLSGVYYYSTPPGSTAGDVLYLSTSGDMTEVAPTTNGEILRVLGQRLDGNRVMFMPSQDFVEIGTTDLNDLSDVNIASAPGAGELLINNATTGQFVNATLTAGNFVKISNTDGAIEVAAGDGAEVEYRSLAVAVSNPGEVEGSILKFGTTATGNTTAGAVYVFNGTYWVEVDADAEATTKGLMGVALGTADTDGFLTHGTAYLSHNPGTAGDILYVSPTLGELTFTQPGTTQFVRVAGYCLAGNKVFFSPSQDWIEVA